MTTMQIIVLVVFSLIALFIIALTVIYIILPKRELTKEDRDAIDKEFAVRRGSNGGLKNIKNPYLPYPH